MVKQCLNKGYKYLILILVVSGCVGKYDNSVPKGNSKKCLLDIVDEKCQELFTLETIKIRKFNPKSRELTLLRVENTQDVHNTTLKLIPQNELNPLLQDAKISYRTFKIHFSKEEWLFLGELIESLPSKPLASIFIGNNGYSIEVFKNNIWQEIYIDLNEKKSWELEPYFQKIDSILVVAKSRTVR